MSHSGAAKSPSDVSITPATDPEPPGRRIKGFRMTQDRAPQFAIYMTSIGATIHEVLFVVEKEDFPVLGDGEPVHFAIVGTREQVEAVRAEAEARGDHEVVEGAIVVEEEEHTEPAGPGPVLATPEDMDAYIEANMAEV